MLNPFYVNEGIHHLSAPSPQRICTYRVLTDHLFCGFTHDKTGKVTILCCLLVLLLVGKVSFFAWFAHFKKHARWALMVLKRATPKGSTEAKLRLRNFCPRAENQTLQAMFSLLAGHPDNGNSFQGIVKEICPDFLTLSPKPPCNHPDQPSSPSKKVRTSFRNPDDHKTQSVIINCLRFYFTGFVPGFVQKLFIIELYYNATIFKSGDSGRIEHPIPE